MLNNELMINKGFSLNEYPEGKFYERTIENPDDELLKVLSYQHEAEKVILQTKEDFTNIVVMIDLDLWNLSNDQFCEILKAL